MNMSNNMQLSASVITFVLAISWAVYAKSDSGFRFNRILLNYGLSPLFTLICVVWTVSNFFTHKGIDESVLYHLEYGLFGAGYSEYWEIIFFAVVLFVIGISLPFLISIFFVARYKLDDLRVIALWSSHLLILTAFALHPATSDIYQLALEKNRNDFYQYYQRPVIKGHQSVSKNIVVIYGESLERTFFDEQQFPGLISELRKLQADSIDFTGLEQVVNTGWTIAGMTASQCGLPLNLPAESDLRSLEGVPSFMAGASCLGDLLKQRGYYLAYLGGASLDFAGKGKFYRSHGFDQVQGREELQPLLTIPEYKTSWGLYDDTLFTIGLTKFVELSRKKQPFGLFMLTLDTHPPDGMPSKTCLNQGIKYADGSNPILNAVACSDFLIARFVREIQQSEFADDTLLVIASDHLAQNNSAIEQLEMLNRKNLFMVIDLSAKQSRMVNTPGSTLDIGATLLPLLGFEGQLGLGRDLLGDSGTLITQLPDINSALKGWKKSIWGFWDYPKLITDIEISETEQSFTLDKRVFRYPVLIKYDESLETTLLFEYERMKLVENLQDLQFEEPFVWIDKCATINGALFRSLVSDADYCFVYGKLSMNELSVRRVSSEVSIKNDDLTAVIGIEPGNREIYLARKHPNIGVGEKIVFDSTAVKFNGWSRVVDRSTSRWSDGKSSEITFYMRSDRQDQIPVGLLDIGIGTLGMQEIVVSLNGKKLGAVKGDSRDTILKVPFDPTLLVVHDLERIGNPQKNVIRFDFPLAKRRPEDDHIFAMDIKWFSIN